MAYELVDWSQAPKLARWWAMDSNLKANWFCDPEVAPFTRFWFADSVPAPSFGYKGDYKDSLTGRPGS